MAGAPELIIDPSIKLWVLIPILVVMTLVGIARHYASILFQPSPPQATIKEIKEQAYLQYAQSLHASSCNLGPEEYSKRARALVQDFRNGTYLANPQQAAPSALPNLADPQSSHTLIAGIRNQVLTYVPQTLTMQWVTAFYGGFVIMKLPFPLTAKFKSMLQANILTHDLDVRWVSSISWYILLLIGLGGVYHIILGGPNEAAQQQYSQCASSAIVAPLPPNIDKRKVFSDEADALELERPKSILAGVQQRVLKIEL